MAADIKGVWRGKFTLLLDRAIIEELTFITNFFGGFFLGGGDILMGRIIERWE